MPIAAAAAIAGVGSIIGGAIGAKGAKKAANIQAASNQEAIGSQENMLQKQIDLQEPFRQSGLTAQNKLLTLLGMDGGDKTSAEFGSQAKPFSAQDFQTDPGYQFRQDQASQALQRSAAARGGLVSGSAMKALDTYSQNIASEEYNNAFNRYQTERQAKLSPLQSLMGQGQQTTGAIAGAIGTTSSGIANNITGAGEARASGYVGASNALAGAINQAGAYGMNYFNNQNAMNLISGMSAKVASPSAYGIAGSDGIY